MLQQWLWFFFYVRGIINVSRKNFNLNQESNPGSLTLKTSKQDQYGQNINIWNLLIMVLGHILGQYKIENVWIKIILNIPVSKTLLYEYHKCVICYNTYITWEMTLIILLCVSITPLGKPVVPLEHSITATSSCGSASIGSKLFDLSERVAENGMCLWLSALPNTIIPLTQLCCLATSSIRCKAISEQNMSFGFEILRAWCNSPGNTTNVLMQK